MSLLDCLLLDEKMDYEEDTRYVANAFCDVVKDVSLRAEVFFRCQSDSRREMYQFK